MTVLVSSCASALGAVDAVHIGRRTREEYGDR